MVESSKACDVVSGCLLVPNVFLVKSHPPRAVSLGGRLEASSDDSHGLSLGVGVRVGPHIGIMLISEVIVGVKM